MYEPDFVEDRPGQCWRCQTPFAPGELVTMVGKHFDFRSPSTGEIRSYPSLKWGAMCPRCTTAEEQADAPKRLKCEGCNQPLAVPYGTLRRVCSERCAQRYRRRRQREMRLITRCEGCDEFFAARGDARFCSSACRQKAYRGRQKTGEPAVTREAPAENVIYLDEVAGVLHYHDTAIIPLTKFHCWPGYGSRQVGAFPLEGVWALQPVRRQHGETPVLPPCRHLFECLHCRRWSVGAGWVFCSRKCRLAYRAEQARERRAAAE